MIEKADYWGEDLMVTKETRIARAPKLAQITPLLNDPTIPLPLDRVHTFKEAMYHPSAYAFNFPIFIEKSHVKIQVHRQMALIPRKGKQRRDIKLQRYYSPDSGLLGNSSPRMGANAFTVESKTRPGIL